MKLTRPPISAKEPALATSDPVVIGLVNNMPDGALESTERQFRQLLFAASHAVPVSLRFFSLPQLPRGEAGRSHVEHHYDDIHQLWTRHLDGLIVTGAEPHARALPDEPYWKVMTQLIDWADEHTTSTIWSCLAAHAVVLHRDGISRHRLETKLSGVFEFNQTNGHWFVAGAPPRWQTPHSRFHDLPEAALVSKGYRVLANSPEAGVDMFLRQDASLSIFLQGHPEYDSEALLREHCRDIRRFLAGETDDYPEMPHDYFDETTQAAFRDLRRRASEHRTPVLLTNFLRAIQSQIHLRYPWCEPAVRFYSNWLSYLAEQRFPGRGRKRNLDGISPAAIANRLPSLA
jgi:homoserine O-succinyltransferase